MLNSQDFAQVLQIDMERLTLFIDHKWIVPLVLDGRPMFRDVDIARAYLIADLADQMGVNDDGIDIVLDLLDQIYGLRLAFSTLIDAMEVRAPRIRLD